MAFYQGQVKSADFFINTLLPVAMGSFNAIEKGSKAAIEIDEASLGGKGSMFDRLNSASPLPRLGEGTFFATRKISSIISVIRWKSGQIPFTRNRCT